MDIYPSLWQNARALVVLKIIFDLGRPAKIKDLAALTGGNHETIEKYCNTLATMGLLTRVSSHSGWTPTAQGFAFMRPSQISDYPKIPLNSAESEPVLNTTTSYIKSNIVEVEVLSGKSAFFSENLTFFQEIGITLYPHTEFLANHVEPKVFKSEWAKLVSKGKPWPGLLIKILSTLPKQKTKEQISKEVKSNYALWEK